MMQFDIVNWQGNKYPPKHSGKKQPEEQIKGYIPDESLANYGGNVGDTTEVGTYSPGGDSPYGCADMAGNVLEWVMEWYNGNYYPILNQVNYPSGANSSWILSRVARGGSWLYPARRARAPLRVDRLPELREGNIGFHCVFPY